MAEATEISLTVIGVGLLVVLTVGLVRSARLYLRLRRRWRLAFSAAGRGRAPVVTAAATSSTWWVAQHERQRMWRAVTRAEQSVRAAVASGVPIGELQSLTRQLRAAAESIDTGLAPGSIIGEPARDLRAQAREVARAADEITSAAGGAIAGDNRPRTDRVVSAIRLELQAVRHGWQR